ncbi:MAG TPA: sensor histidine kinase, partial [Myxococcales bacterium]|nr:sensor histidine kinase [Myxococcales bacterium]
MNSPLEIAPEAMSRLVTLRWLVRLRWVTIGGLLLVIAFARLAVPESAALGATLALVAAAGASNVAMDRWARRSSGASNRLLAAILAFDVLLLTALLAIAGGPGNPFSVIYLVQVTLAAVVLGARWAWALVGATVVCFGALFLIAPSHALHVHGSTFPLHLQGMWVAFGVTASLIAYFVTQIAA